MLISRKLNEIDKNGKLSIKSLSQNPAPSMNCIYVSSAPSVVSICDENEFSITHLTVQYEMEFNC